MTSSTITSSAMKIQDQVSQEEWQARVELAAAYRLMALYGLDDLIYTHISARVPDSDHHFLINPIGLLFEEITASSLLKVDLDGNKLMPSEFEANKAGFVIHSAVHAAREDAACVLHCHTDYGVAVSMQKDGLLPLSQMAIVPHALLSYHDYEGVAVRDDEKERLVANLGNNLFMILRNHGTLTVGSSVGQAVHFMIMLERACKMQVMAQAGGAELNPITDEAYKNALEGSITVGAQASPFPGLMRKLDRLDPSYKT